MPSKYPADNSFVPIKEPVLTVEFDGGIAVLGRLESFSNFYYERVLAVDISLDGSEPFRASFWFSKFTHPVAHFRHIKPDDFKLVAQLLELDPTLVLRGNKLSYDLGLCITIYPDEIEWEEFLPA